MSIVGSSVSPPTNWNPQEESAWWIGKPWRRLEYFRHRTFYKDECVDTTRTWSATLGLRRLGWHFHFSVTRACGMDYSDEEYQ